MAQLQDPPRRQAHRKRPSLYQIMQRSLLTNRLTFWMRCLRLISFFSTALTSREALTFVLTFCRKEATNLTLISDSSNAAVISLSVASNTLCVIYQEIKKQTNTDSQTFSSTTGARFKDDRAAFNLRPRSARTICSSGSEDESKGRLNRINAQYLLTRNDHNHKHFFHILLDILP